MVINPQKRENWVKQCWCNFFHLCSVPRQQALLNYLVKIVKSWFMTKSGQRYLPGIKFLCGCLHTVNLVFKVMCSIQQESPVGINVCGYWKITFWSHNSESQIFLQTYCRFLDRCCSTRMRSLIAWLNCRIIRIKREIQKRKMRQIKRRKEGGGGRELASVI